KAVGHEARGVKTPRNFAIEPTGRIMLVANQSGKSVISFHINQETGELTPTGNQIEVGSPVCVRFVPLTKYPALCGARNRVGPIRRGQFGSRRCALRSDRQGRTLRFSFLAPVYSVRCSGHSDRGSTWLYRSGTHGLSPRLGSWKTPTPPLLRRGWPA